MPASADPVGTGQMSTPLRVSIIIPAYNEEAAIGQVIDEIPRDLVQEIIVVSNASTDRTVAVARDHGAITVEEQRKGYGQACLKGHRTMASSSDTLVILDGDHSDYPEDLPLLLKPIEEGKADLVIGSRTLLNQEKGALFWNQRFGNALTCTLLRILSGYAFSDLGPFRAMTRRCFEQMNLQDTTFGWNVEMQVKALILGFTIKEVPVRYRRRIGVSKISGTITGTVRAGLKILTTVCKFAPALLRLRCVHSHRPTP